MSEPTGAGRAILEAIARLEAKIDRLLAQPAAPAAGVASDADLDGQYGDPSIRKDPPRWKGAPYVGQTMSHCSPEYLDELAGFMDWKAGKDEEKAGELDEYEGNEDEVEKKRKYAKYARIDAARARGWARRLRAGWKPPVPQGDSSTDGW